MKKMLIPLALSATLVLAAALTGQSFTYVGASKCAICHKSEAQGKQFPIWQASKHSQSLGALSSPQAAEYAKAADVQNPPESPACLKCHAPLAEKAPELKADGVSCEVCHGPGSEYKKMNIMKDVALAKQSGLIVYADQEAVKKQCLTCHADAHGKTFDFAAAFEKIKHNKPAQ